MACQYLYIYMYVCVLTYGVKHSQDPTELANTTQSQTKQQQQQLSRRSPHSLRFASNRESVREKKSTLGCYKFTISSFFFFYKAILHSKTKRKNKCEGERKKRTKKKS